MNLMKKLLRNGLRVVLLSWLAVTAALAAEARVELGGELNARWLVPEAGWDGRAVLILHGFASDSEGPMASQKRLAEALAARGIASLRVNFRGEGDAARTEILSTYGGRIEDVETARAWLVAQPGVAAGRTGVCGWSLGGSSAIGAGARHPDWFKSMALWSSVSGDLGAMMSGGMLAEVAAQAERDGVGSREIAGWKTVTLRREFFASYRGVDIDAELAKYPGAFLSVRGSEDYLPAAEGAWMKIVKGRPAEAVIIGGADHIFNVFEPGALYLDRAVEVTAGWFERTL